MTGCFNGIPVWIPFFVSEGRMPPSSVEPRTCLARTLRVCLTNWWIFTLWLTADSEHDDIQISFSDVKAAGCLVSDSEDHCPVSSFLSAWELVPAVGSRLLNQGELVINGLQCGAVVRATLRRT